MPGVLAVFGGIGRLAARAGHRGYAGRVCASVARSRRAAGTCWATVIQSSGRRDEGHFPLDQSGQAMSCGARSSPSMRLANASRHAILAFRPDGKMLVAGCADGSVRVWDLLPR